HEKNALQIAKEAKKLGNDKIELLCRSYIFHQFHELIKDPLFVKEAIKVAKENHIIYLQYLIYYQVHASDLPEFQPYKDLQSELRASEGAYRVPEIASSANPYAPLLWYNWMVSQEPESAKKQLEFIKKFFSLVEFDSVQIRDNFDLRPEMLRQ